MPHRYDTIVGERGTALSAGERQRIALARAFLADPEVLVLDEPTASLDAATERLVMDGYEAVMRGRTTIVITHRQDVAARADRVLALHHGGRGGAEEALVLAGVTSASPASSVAEG